jgi:hypothetical protein
MNKLCNAKTEIFSRVVGYFSPISHWNPGKRQEFKDRKNFDDPDEIFKRKRRKNLMNNFEHQEQVALFRWLGIMSGQHPELKMAFAIPNGGHRHIAVARKLKAEGVKPGVPDVFLAHPAKGKNGMFIEMKSAKGKVSPEQAEWLSFLDGDGYQAELCFSWLEAARLICEYLDIDKKEAGLGNV